MRHRKNACRTENTRQNQAARPIFKHSLDESAKNQLLANGNRNHDGEECQALGGILREYFHGQLRQCTFHFGGVRRQASEAEELIRKNQSPKRDGHNRRESRPRKADTETLEWNSMVGCAPQDDCSCEPWKRYGRCIDPEAIALGGFRDARQLANAAPAEK